MIQAHEAIFRITYNGQQGDLADPVSWDAADGDLKTWAAEAVRNGNVPGIDADRNVSFHDFVVDRFAAKDGQPHRVALRPKTPFGS